MLIPVEYQPYLAAYGQFMADHQPRYLAVEQRVYSPTYGYAGTLDRVAVIDERCGVLDLKCTSRLHPETGLQLVAYQLAYNEDGGECAFDPETHTYMDADSVIVPGVTRIIEQLGMYDGVPVEVMERASVRGTDIHALCEMIDRATMQRQGRPRARMAVARWALRLCPDGSYEFREYDREDDVQAFLACLDIYRWKEAHTHNRNPRGIQLTTNELAATLEWSTKNHANMG